jgi:hypothetical protein
VRFKDIYGRAPVIASEENSVIASTARHSIS